MTRPFDSALTYRKRGWLGTLPLPVGRKKHPPAGYTGAEGGWPTEERVYEWLRNGSANIALRLPEDVVGIDVDAYPPKRGGATLADLEDRLGPLPATWVSTSREDGSGIRLFRIRPDLGARLHDPGADIELIRHDHRYIVASPSLHPEGRRYRWLRPDGAIAGDDELPAPGELPELPEAWLVELGRQRALTEPPAESRADGGDRYTKRGEILRLAGSLRYATLDAGEIERALLDRLADGRIYDSDPARPWTKADLSAIARDIGNRPGPPDWPAHVTVNLADAVDPTIGTLTARDLGHGTPPAPLADPYLTPEGPTVIYARGGTGKGITTCWLISQLVRASHVVMVVDFEGHEREWGSRLRGLGLTDDELAKVHYRAPFGPDWTAETGPLSKVAPLIRDDAARLGVTYMVVDSYSVATSNGDTMGGEAAAREYFTGLAVIGLPSLTIAHVRGDSGRFPDRPFGSVFVHNLARETWAAERISEEPDAAEVYGPHVVELELRNRKANGRAMAAPQFLTFSFYGDASIEANADRPSGRSVADEAATVLAPGVPMTTREIAAAIKEDTDREVDETTVRRSLRREPRRFAPSSDRPKKWTLR